MNALLQLLIRHALAACGGFFAAHQINGSSTSGIIVGLMLLAVPVVWSWLANLLRIDAIKPAGFDITKNEIFRTLLAALVSQGITALSVYFAVDADNPELLLGAVLNAGASRFGLHQKALGMPGLKLLLLSASVLSLASCASFTKQDAINYGERVGLAAADTAIFLAHMQLASAEADLTAAMSQPGANKSEIAMKRLAVATAQQALNAATRAVDKRRGHLDAKQPTAATSEACPPCLKLTPRVIVPRYGVEVAAALKVTP